MSTFRQITTTTTDEEIQIRNGQDHNRVYDPDNRKLLLEILDELKKMNIQLSLMTEEEL